MLHRNPGLHCCAPVANSAEMDLSIKKMFKEHTIYILYYNILYHIIVYEIIFYHIILNYIILYYISIIVCIDSIYNINYKYKKKTEKTVTQTWKDVTHVTYQ